MDTDFSFLDDQQLHSAMTTWQNVQKKLHPSTLGWQQASEAINAIAAENALRYPQESK